MTAPWTNREIAILREMRESGHDWEEISVATLHPPRSCQTKATSEKIWLNGQRPKLLDLSITDDLHHRNNGRPMAKEPEIRPCIGCKKMFKSWDRRKNQRCSRCAGMSDNNFAY